MIYRRPLKKERHNDIQETGPTDIIHKQTHDLNKQINKNELFLKGSRDWTLTLAEVTEVTGVTGEMAITWMTGKMEKEEKEEKKEKKWGEKEGEEILADEPMARGPRANRR